MMDTYTKLEEEYAKAVRGEASAWVEAAEAHAGALELYVLNSGMSELLKKEELDYAASLRAAAKAAREKTLVQEELTAALKEQQDALRLNHERIQKLIDDYKYSQSAAVRYGVTIQDITGYMVKMGREAELFGLDWEYIGENANRMAQALSLSIRQVASETGKLRGETSELAMEIDNIIQRFQYEQSEAGKLGVTFDDIVSSLYAAGINAEWMAGAFASMGDKAKDVNALLSALGLTARDIASYMSGEKSAGFLLRQLILAANEKGFYLPAYQIPGIPLEDTGGLSLIHI